MCFTLYLASPLTLSEVRSMPDAGIAVNLVTPAERRRLLAAHDDARTAATLAIGACACRLTASPAVEERVLRARYRALGYDRSRVIEGLERHRQGRAGRHPAGHWPDRLAAFVAEHARNAGPTLYFLHFSLDGVPRDLTVYPPAHLQAGAVRHGPTRWLEEDTRTMVTA